MGVDGIKNSADCESVKVETPPELPRKYKTLQSVTLYDVRECLSAEEKDETLRHVEEVFDMITSDGELVQESELEVDGVRVDELSLARMIEETEEIVSEHVFNRERNRDYNSQILAEGEARLAYLNGVKKKFLAFELEKIIQGSYGDHLRLFIRDFMLRIQKSRKDCGDEDFYTRDDIVVVAYEIIYEAFLWRKELRKKEPVPYFDAHLVAAANELVDHNLTQRHKVLGCFKHDTEEDLKLHKKDFTNKSERKYRSDWGFCDVLYRDKLTAMSGNDLDALKQNTLATVHAMTKKDLAKPPPSEDTRELRKARDQEVLLHVHEQFRDVPDAVIVKVMEQPQNSTTIAGLGHDRAPEKLSGTILRHWAVLAKLLQLRGAYVKLAGGGIDYYDGRLEKNIRDWFNAMQRERVFEACGIGGSVSDSLPSLIERLFHEQVGEAPPIADEPDINALTLSLFDVSNDSAEADAVRLETRNRIRRVFSPFDERVECIKIIPSALEDFVDVRKLDEKDYWPDVPNDHPLCEVLILVKDEADLKSLRAKLVGIIDPDSFDGPTGAVPEDMPNKGVVLYITDDESGCKIPIRINTSRKEAIAKRGVVGTGRPLPAYLRRRQRLALNEAKLRGPVPKTHAEKLEIIENILLRDTIVVTTDPPRGRDGKKSKRTFVALPEGSTVFDLMSALRGGTFRFDALAYAVGASVARRQPDDDFKLWDKLIDGDSYRILLLPESDRKPVNSQFDIGCAAFACDERFPTLANQYYARQIQPDHSKFTSPEEEKEEMARVKQEKTRASINRATEYLDRLSDIFNFFGERGPAPCILSMYALNLPWFDDETTLFRLEQLSEIIEVLREEEDEEVKKGLRSRMVSIVDEIKAQFSEAKGNTLIRIGNMRFDPLKALAPYVNRKRRVVIEMHVDNHEGVSAYIDRLCFAHGLNIHRTNAKPISGNQSMHIISLTLDPPPRGLSSYDLLRFILKLHYCDFTSELHVDPRLFMFPEVAQTALLFGKLCDGGQVSDFTSFLPEESP